MLKTVVLHHSALPLSYGPKEIQLLHMRERGFADIGYHFVIDPDGRIFEGRDIAVRGAHTAGHNTGTIGVVLLGDLSEGDPPAAQWTATEALIRLLCRDYAITHLAGHRDFVPDQTICPGPSVEALVHILASSLDLQVGISGNAPAQETLPPVISSLEWMYAE